MCNLCLGMCLPGDLPASLHTHAAHTQSQIKLKNGCYHLGARSSVAVVLLIPAARLPDDGNQEHWSSGWHQAYLVHLI